ncbi:MAG: hypothetical protein JW982_02425 [Spirochaetes bacterium]|nr:hypothetical protein [Spirochaetota bacterium]
MKANKILTVICLITLFLSSCTSTNKEIFIKNKEELRKPVKVTVLPLTDAVGKQGSGTIVSDALTNELIKIPNWTLVERSQLQKVLGEKELDMSGMTTSDAAQIGQLLKTDYIITGNIATYNYKRQLGIVPITKINFTLRIINVSTGEIVGTINYERETNKYWAAGCCIFGVYYVPYIVIYSLTVDKNINHDLKKASQDIVNQINLDINNKRINSGCM